MYVILITFLCDTFQPGAVFEQPIVCAGALSEMFLITALRIAMTGVPPVVAVAVKVASGGFDVNAAWAGVIIPMTKLATPSPARYFFMFFMFFLLVCSLGISAVYS